jgi:hypothetical protein
MFKIKSQIPFDNAVHSQVAPVTIYIYIYIYCYWFAFLNQKLNFQT